MSHDTYGGDDMLGTLSKCCRVAMPRPSAVPNGLFSILTHRLQDKIPLPALAQSPGEQVSILARSRGQTLGPFSGAH